MSVLAQQISLQHNKLQSLIDSIALYGNDEAGSVRGSELVSDFADLMRRHLALESRQLSLRTLDVAAASDYDTCLHSISSRLDALLIRVAAMPQAPLADFGAPMRDLLNEHLLHPAHKKLVRIS